MNLIFTSPPLIAYLNITNAFTLVYLNPTMQINSVCFKLTLRLIASVFVSPQIHLRIRYLAIVLLSDIYLYFCLDHGEIIRQIKWPFVIGNFKLSSFYRMHFVGGSIENSLVILLVE